VFVFQQTPNILSAYSTYWLLDYASYQTKGDVMGGACGMIGVEDKLYNFEVRGM
jgi:hypothetical protein